MTSRPRPPKRDRTKPPLAVDYSNEFAKDWIRLERSGRFDLRRLKAVMMALIAADGPLEASRRDHALIGDWRDHRECHVGGDFLLIYRATDTSVVFVRAGTHADLFE